MFYYTHTMYVGLFKMTWVE